MSSLNCEFLNRLYDITYIKPRIGRADRTVIGTEMLKRAGPIRSNRILPDVSGRIPFFE
jgi:hypothetical protein